MEHRTFVVTISADDEAALITEREFYDKLYSSGIGCVTRMADVYAAEPGPREYALRPTADYITLHTQRMSPAEAASVAANLHDNGYTTYSRPTVRGPWGLW